MQSVSHKKLYLSAVTLIVIVLLLLVMIAVSTYQMLNHQKETALGFIHSHGLTLLHALEAAAMTGLQPPWQDADAVERLIRELAKRDNVAAIYIFDPHGTISHASLFGLKGAQTPWRPAISDDNPVVARLHRTDQGEQRYELAKHFTPSIPMPSGQTPHIGAGNDGRPPAAHHADDTVVLSMSLEAIEAAHRLDVQHALIMGAVLLVLGTATLFFTFIIQNYRLVARALNQSRDELRRVVASMPNGMLSVDEQGKITSINGPARALLGIDGTDLRQCDLSAVIDFPATGIDQTLANGTPVNDKEILLQRPGGSVPLAISAAPIIDPDAKAHNAGAVLILRDLTEIKALQERVRHSERLAGIGALAATVAHEVRNPLSSIRGFARFLAQLHQDRPQEREYAELMVKEVDRINKVVTNLLTFANPVAPEPAPTDLAALLAHAVRLVQEDAGLRQVAINTTVAHQLGPVNIDGHQFTQAMLNLMRNALQAVEAGGTIQIEVRRTDAELLEVTVEDDGPGIAPGEMEKIFEPFYTTREQGTGLGLAIVQTIVAQHGGELRIDSPPPGKARGTLVTLQLPG